MSRARKRLILVVGVLLLLLPVLVLTNCNRKSVGQAEQAESLACGYEDPPRPAPGVRMLAAAAASVLGLRRVAVVNGNPSQLATDVGAHWQTLSDGKATFEFNGFSASVSGCDPGAVAAAIVAALDDRVDWTTYQHIVANQSTSGCGYGGIGRVVTLQSDDGPVTLGIAIFSSSASLRVARHEFGHALGLHHAGLWACGSDSMRAGGPLSCTVSEYGDNGSVMGSASGGANAWEKKYLGWWTDAVATVTESGSYSLAPNASGAGLRALEIRRSIEDYMYVEFASAGAALHALEWSAQSFLIDASPSTSSYVIPVGGILTDPGTGEVIEVLAASSGGMTIRVTAQPADLARPTVTLAPIGPSVSGVEPLSATVTDDRGIYRVRFIALNSARTSVFDGSSYAEPYGVTWDTATLAPGDYSVRAYAYDLAGNQGYSAESRITIGTQPSPTFTSPPPSQTATAVIPLATVTPSPVGAATKTPTRTPTRRIPPGWLKKTPKAP